MTEYEWLRSINSIWFSASERAKCCIHVQKICSNHINQFDSSKIELLSGFCYKKNLVYLKNCCLHTHIIQSAIWTISYLQLWVVWLAVSISLGKWTLTSCKLAVNLIPFQRLHVFMVGFTTLTSEDPSNTKHYQCQGWLNRDGTPRTWYVLHILVMVTTWQCLPCSVGHMSTNEVEKQVLNMQNRKSSFFVEWISQQLQISVSVISNAKAWNCCQNPLETKQLAIQVLLCTHCCTAIQACPSIHHSLCL